MVSAHLLAVTAGVTADREISIIAYFDGPPKEEDIEEIEDVCTETLANFDRPYLVDGVEYLPMVGRVQARDVHDFQPIRPLDFWAYMSKAGGAFAAHDR